MTTPFVVVKTGVNIRDVYGPFEGDTNAKAFAQQQAAADSDDYHEWVVQPLTLEGLGHPIAEYRKLGRWDRLAADGENETQRVKVLRFGHKAR